MSDNSPKDQLQREQDAFNATLPRLLSDHEGEYVVFKDEMPVGFFGSLDAAYREALRRYGLESVFLISEVARKGHESSSVSWDFGVLYAE